MAAMELPLYWSDAFVDVFVKALGDDAAFQKAARRFHGVVVLRCLDAPGGDDVEATYRIDAGVVTASVRRERAPSSGLRQAPFDKAVALARTTASYDLWRALDRGEMSVVRAIASPDYHVEGSKLSIVSNIGVFNAMSAVAAGIDKRYA